MPQRAKRRATRRGLSAGSLFLRRPSIYKAPRRQRRDLEHETGLEPATSTLATRPTKK